jgi:hypothetical protein
MRPVQLALKRQFSFFRDHFLSLVKVDVASARAIQWWLNRLNTAVGVPLGPVVPNLQMFTDASDWGWVAHLSLLQENAPWTESEATASINF